MSDRNDLDRVQHRVGEWAARTFPRATNDSITSHVIEEAEELATAAHVDDDGIGEIGEEAADCLLLLLHLAHRNGFSLCDAMAAKHAVNVVRTWETDDGGRGHWKHRAAEEERNG